MDEIRKQLLLGMGFSLKAVSVLESNLNMSKMDEPTVTQQHKGKCGDILILSLQIQNDRIADARYDYIGCAGLQACASAMTEMIKGRTLIDAEQIEISDIINYLESIPEQKYECAEISRDTLRKALAEFRKARPG